MLFRSKGWKLKKISLIAYNGKNSEKYSHIKNGKTAKLGKYGTDVEIKAENVKSGAVATFSSDIHAYEKTVIKVGKMHKSTKLLFYTRANNSNVSVLTTVTLSYDKKAPKKSLKKFKNAAQLAAILNKQLSEADNTLVKRDGKRIKIYIPKTYALIGSSMWFKWAHGGWGCRVY